MNYHVDYLEWGEYPTHTTEYEGEASSLQEIQQQLRAQTIEIKSILTERDWHDLWRHETLYVSGIEGINLQFSTDMESFMEASF